MNVLSILIREGKIDAALAVTDAVGNTNSKRFSPKNAEKVAVTKEQAEHLATQDVSVLQSRKTSKGTPIYKEVKLLEAQEDSYKISVKTLNNVDRIKSREIINPTTIKCPNGQFIEFD